MFTILERADTDSTNAAFVESTVVINEGLGEMLRHVEVHRLLEQDGVYLYHVSVHIGLADVDKILAIASLLAERNLTKALAKIQKLNAKQPAAVYRAGTFT